MKNNYPTHEDDMSKMVARLAAEGAAGGLMAFLRNQGVVLGKEAAPKFISAILAEYLVQDEDMATPYPFDASVREAINEALLLEAVAIRAMYLAGEIDHLEGYVHVIIGDTVAGFLEDRKVRVMALIKELSE